MHKLLLSVLLTLSITLVQAQSKKHQEVAAAVEALRVAMIDGDSTRLSDLVADSLTYGHSGGLVEDKTSFVHKFVTGQSDFVTIDLADQTINVDDDVAIVRHSLFAKTNDNGKPGEVKLKILTVWKKKKGGWKMIARQAVKTA